MDVRLVNEARWVLSDPERRAAWEVSRSCKLLWTSTRDLIDSSASAHLREPVKVEPHISRHVSLEEFEPHDTESAKPALVDENAVYYTYPCRCSGQFVITTEDLEAGVEVIGCEGCGEWLRVGYEAIADGEPQSGNGTTVKPDSR